MNEIISLDETYSTTRHMLKAQPEVIAELIKQSAKSVDQFETQVSLPVGENRQGEGGLRTKGYYKVGGLIPDVSVNASREVVSKKKLNHEIVSGVPSTLQTEYCSQQKPLITIVTVVFNGEIFLEDTILSVINQNYDNVEYIIIDGGSTDGTLDIIKKYENTIDYWVSESDQGIYHAMNKSLILSLGEFVFHLNAGDRVKKDALRKVFANEYKDTSLIVGAVRYESGAIFHSNDSRMVIKNMIHHQSAFYLVSTLKKIGLYKLQYDILSDYYLNSKIYILKYKIKRVPIEISYCTNFGVSDIPKLKNYIEEIKVREAIFGLNMLTIILRVYSYGRFFLKKFMFFYVGKLL
jgi:hypothetical protein